ncbi:hypothetical protein AMC83_CH04148 [Rhizobium phaseoli]|nr:hypothetical protein AMC83_CH04148 [Rhizobium phaseoli]
MSLTLQKSCKQLINKKEFRLAISFRRRLRTKFFYLNGEARISTREPSDCFQPNQCPCNALFLYTGLEGVVEFGVGIPPSAAVALPKFLTGFFSLPDNHTAQLRERPLLWREQRPQRRFDLSCALARVYTLLRLSGLCRPIHAILAKCCCIPLAGVSRLAPMNSHFYLLGDSLSYLYFAQ